MLVSKSNIEIINERLEYLYENFYIDPIDKEIKIGDEEILIDFPRDSILGYPIEEFLRYTSGLENIRVIENHSVICGQTRQTIIYIENYNYDSSIPKLKFEIDNISLEIVENPFLIGIIASRDGIYDKYTGVTPCSIYSAIELQYKDVEPDEERDIELIKNVYSI